MQREGPLLETLTRRLAETPPEFLDEPRLGDKAGVAVPALVHDLLRMHGARSEAKVLARFASNDAARDRNRLALVQLACWLLADRWFIEAACAAEALLGLLDVDAAELAAATSAHKFVRDPDRREELARVVLARLGYRPQGETVAQATDRLSAISGTERKRLVAASRAAEERAREIREALAKKAAAESADKWTRE